MIFKYNLNKIWEMQKALDSTILENNNLNYSNTFKNRSLAFIIELAEFSNETREFKYWSKRPASGKDILLEEYIDGIHFIVSQAIYFECKKKYELEKSSLSIVELTIETFRLSSLVVKEPSKKLVESIINLYLQIGIYYGFSNEDIMTHYIKKNKINYQRIQDNY